MKHIGIQKPCSENWAGMTPTEKGAFCQQCCKQVHDFSNQTIPEIRETLHKNKGQETCARITNEQLDTLNSDYELWRSSSSWNMQRVSLYAFIVVFGMSIVSCNNEASKRTIATLQKAATSLVQAIQSQPEDEIIMGEIAEIPPSIEDFKVIEDVEPMEEELIEKNRLISCEDVTIQHEYITMGAMAYYDHYDRYLDQVVPIEESTERYDENGVLIPETFAALAFPNPTIGRTTLKFEAPRETNVSFSLYSATGQMMKSLGSASYVAGTHEIPFDLSAQRPGTYLITILSKDFKETVRVVKM